MSEESTTPDLEEAAARLAEAINARDFDALQGFWGPDPILDMSPLGLGVYEGAASVRAFMEDWLGAYDEFDVEVEEIRDLGNGVGFHVAVQRGIPRGSMGRIQVRYGAVSTIVDGRGRTTFYYDIDQARAAAERLVQERG